MILTLVLCVLRVHTHSLCSASASFDTRTASHPRCDGPHKLRSFRRFVCLCCVVCCVALCGVASVLGSACCSHERVCVPFRNSFAMSFVIAHANSSKHNTMNNNNNHTTHNHTNTITTNNTTNNNTHQDTSQTHILRPPLQRQSRHCTPSS